MRHFPATPFEMFSSLWRNRELIKASAKREVMGRYQGSFFGLLWSFLNPIFMLAVFTFVFSIIFQARWGAGSGSKAEFSLVLFAGLLIFNLFAECVNRSPNIILSNSNYVKKVLFPLEVLPFVAILSALFHMIIGIGIWLIAYAILLGIPHHTVLYLPLILLPFCLFLMGLSWALASLGVFLRDVSQLIGPMTTALMFMSPVFYPVTAFPEEYRYLLYLNPLTTVIDQARDVLFWSKTPNFLILGIYWFLTSGIAWLGFAWFQKTRKGFADVL
jgi:lipopolysaccharide transport system permease protein